MSEDLWDCSLHNDPLACEAPEVGAFEECSANGERATLETAAMCLGAGDLEDTSSHVGSEATISFVGIGAEWGAELHVQGTSLL